MSDYRVNRVLLTYPDELVQLPPRKIQLIEGWLRINDDTRSNICNLELDVSGDNQLGTLWLLRQFDHDHTLQMRVMAFHDNHHTVPMYRLLGAAHITSIISGVIGMKHTLRIRLSGAVVEE